MENAPANRINIRPGVSMLSVLRHLNYRAWYAMAEFVDNAIQSSISCSKELAEVERGSYQLNVSIDIDPIDRSRITIRDNAGGIHEKDYPRAFRPAQLPPDRTGLAEFGMGMKSAACWFAPKWTVRTSALGESISREVTFDVKKIVEDNINELDVTTYSAASEEHFTEIVLSDLHKPIHGITVKKIKEHLASIYRFYLREGSLNLKFDGETLSCPMPPILTAAYYKNPNGDLIQWSKEIKFDFGDDLKVHGFAALRETASTTHAGFALFRRNRLIEGSGDEAYRPDKIFGRPNSFRYQRVFGELHLEGFEVSHTKDGFKWDENEEAFLDLMKEHLDAMPMPILQQAEEYRAKSNPIQLKKAADAANERTAKIIEKEAASILQPQMVASPPGPIPTALSEAASASKREFELFFSNSKWHVTLDLCVDASVGEWVEISQVDPIIANSSPRKIAIRLSLTHPFMERFSGADSSYIEPLLRVAVALCLGEVTALESGVKFAGTIRRNVNELLRKVFSKP